MMHNRADAQKFLAQFWQKKPLFKRGALREFASVLDRQRMFELAGRDDLESRLVMRERKAWHVEHGPFRKRDFAGLPRRDWTLLVNSLETAVPEARSLQQAFDFVPYARHDDVMASYAAPGGSVGPHFDSYDVFLVQGAGRRHWQIGRPRNSELIAGAPLKILRTFKPQREWRVAAGDVLYLPPRYAHHGVAIDECITWSVGFRAPGQREITERFLDFLRDQERPDMTYRDPHLGLQRHPGAIGKDMLLQIQDMVNSLTWRDADIERCLGEYLTEPRAGIVFRKARPVSAQRFSELSHARGIRLALPSRMLIGKRIFINGDSAARPAAGHALLNRLADTRRLAPGVRIPAATCALLYEWYRAGYIDLLD
jgi:50S ribosomal protein L16 3-hydroxylase